MSDLGYVIGCIFLAVAIIMNSVSIIQIKQSIKDIKPTVQINCYKQTIDDDATTILHRIKCPE